MSSNPDEEASLDELTRASKVVFSASLEEPLTRVNATLRSRCIGSRTFDGGIQLVEYRPRGLERPPLDATPGARRARPHEEPHE